MKASVFKFGLISSVTVLILFFISYLFLENLSFAVQEIWGYLSIFIALSFVFFGVKSYRDGLPQKEISFGRALGAGMLIVIFPAIIFGLFNVIYITYLNPDFTEQYYAAQVANTMTQYSGAELSAKLVEMESMKDLASSGGFTFILMTSTVLILGFIVSLITAATLRSSGTTNAVLNN
ncbi:MAG: hypothetical protein ACI8ZM_005401 [Crocinitomix sp.]|jgi:hypothetical protein